MKKKLKLLLVGLTVFATLPLFGGGHYCGDNDGSIHVYNPQASQAPCYQETTCCNPSPSCCQPALSWLNRCSCFLYGVEVGSNALYWRSIGEGIQYALVEDLTNGSQAKYTLPRSRFGYDIWGEAILFNPCFALAGRYVSFNAHSGDAVSAPEVVPSFLPLLPGFVNQVFGQGQLREKYRSGDIEARWDLKGNCFFRGGIFGGVRYFDITQTEDYLYNNGAVASTATQKISYRGWGPRLGLRFAFDPFFYRLCPFAISLRGYIAATATIGDRRNILDVNTTLTQLTPLGFLTYPKRRVLNPALDWRLELVGEWHICNLFVSARIGYEQDIYFAAFSRIFTSNLSGTPTVVQNIAGFGGPFAGISIGY